MTSSDEIERQMARGRGVLSDADRKWLLLSREEFIEAHSRQYWGQRRDKIKKRVRDAILDFSLLWEHWDRDERWDHRAWWELRGLDGSPPYDEPIDDREIERGLRDMAAFALFLTRADALFRPEDPQFAESLYVEEFLLLVFRRLGEEYRRYVRSVELEVEGEDLMWGQIRRALEEGEDIPAEKLLLALEMDTLDTDPEPIREEIQEVFRRKLQDEQPGQDGG